jgi:hypothetical protein
MNIDIEKLVKNVSQIKLKGGIFEKASVVIIVVSICLFGIAVSTGNIWVSCGAIGLIFILAFVGLWRLISFANNNPQAAILEGAEFLVHEKIQLAAKGISEIPQSIANLTEETPIVINAKIEKEANIPDSIKGREGNNG